MAPPLERLKAAVACRARYWQRLQTTYNLIAKLKEEKSLATFKARLKDLPTTYQKYETCLDLINDLNNQVDEEEKITDVLSTAQAFDTMYYEILAAEAMLPKPDPPPSPPAPNPPAPIGKPKLPQLNIPMFDGSYEKFSAFKSLYDTLIHNQESLSIIEKYSYLRSLLSGPALHTIEGYPFSSDHYAIAYATLVNRFSNKRIVASNICNKLFAIKPFSSECQLPSFLESFHVQVEALRNVRVGDLSNFFLSFMALRILDTTTRQAFENARPDKESIPSYDSIVKFIQGRVAVAELVPTPKYVTPKPMGFPMKPVLKRSLHANVVKDSPPPSTPQGNTCPCCNKGHRIHECSIFQAMSVPDRYNALRESHLCFSCMGPHSRSACTSKYYCRHCHSKGHHTMLHTPSASPQAGEPSTSHQATIVLSNNVVPVPAERQMTQVLLGTALISIMDAFGQYHDVRALIDSGSMITIMTQSLSERLALPCKPSNIQVQGVGSSKLQPAKGVVACTINSKCSSFALAIEAAVLPSIAANLPTMPVPVEIYNQLSNVKLADPTFGSPAPVQLLIGAQYYANLVNRSEPIITGKPSLIPTMLGTLVMGECPSAMPTAHHSFFISQSEEDVSCQLKKFWEMEEVAVNIPEDPEDLQCERHFVETHYRDPAGIYVVRLPFRNGTPPNLGNNVQYAKSRLTRLESTLSRKPEFKTLYHENLIDYVEQGHMVVAKEPSTYVMTHHGVTKDSSTTKVRVVFNPAEKASPSHSSLNESLLVGPKLQNNINDIMLNFRLHPVAITADIKQMYRAIKLDPKDSKFQQILWRSDPSQPIKQYEITRVCFGVTSSPFHALRVLKQLIKDEGDNYPMAAKVLDRDAYIDDICSGSASVADARRLREELTALLSAAGFELRKWSSSHPEVLNDLSIDLCEKPHKFGDIETIQVLGIQWDPKRDVFCYQIKSIPNCTTKRQILSQIARVYDLPGLLGPVVIWMKILLQKIWLQGLQWDDPLPKSMIEQWNHFIAEMPCLGNLEIPRCIVSTYIYPPEIIGFSDASSSAMSAVVYLRVRCSDERILVHIIRAKTKVAPVKPMSIPRLELTASYLLALLIESLSPLRSQLHIETIHLFTDSMVVLSWLRTPPHLLKVFVANRVVKILEITTPSHWSHVPTAENPADIASRGCMPSQLLSHDLWWYGPAFLKQDPLSWPRRAEEIPVSEVPELKPSAVLSANLSVDTGGKALIERFSSLTHAKRVVAWMLRFKRNCLCKPEDRQYGALSVHELSEAEHSMIKVTQAYYYPDILEAVAMGKKLPVSIHQLSPIIFRECLRVGGRLDKAPLPYDSRHPYLLPASSHLARLIVRYFHEFSLHGGPRIVQSLVHSKYYVPGLRNLVRKLLFQCVKCYRLTAKPREPVMAELPISRFKQGRPFLHTGVDLAGPFALKDGSRRNSPIIKAYFAIFVCFAVKAIHLELLTSLSTQAFLSSFDRFVARRGLPLKMFSDQGTNFKGASRFLDETYKFLCANNNAISDHLSLQNVQWTFNAPANPSAGGLWEAGVKSVKSHLKVLLHNRSLQFEEFSTVLCRIEAIVNSRPIGIPASSPEDVSQCLTPGHFLVGGPLLSRPEPDLTDTIPNRLTRWEFLSQITQHLWKRWAREYLHTLIQRQKWCSPSESIKVGDIVVLTVENQPPMSWPLARVIKLLPAQDGVVRIVSIQTNSGVLTRPVRKLLVLPICP
ncbi:hypothetical protein M8J77_022802 [Diaphorina citri]|nr:hypothetical protein M8J77_022802 [Diaphorina citri]